MTEEYLSQTRWEC